MKRFIIRPPYRILIAQNGERRLLLFVRLAIELLIAGSQAADGAGFQLLAAGSKKANSYHFISFIDQPDVINKILQRRTN